MRLLVVEDDHMLGKALKVALEQDHYSIDWVDDGDSAIEALATTAYEAVILDVNLPNKTGLQVLENLRSHKNDIPVLLLTARDAARQKVEGLNAGADDYMVKPFDLDELLARIRALIRRSHGRSNPLLTRGNLVLYPLNKVATLDKQSLDLSAREFAVLAILLEHQGRVLDRQAIEEKMFGWDIEIESNAIEVYISRLRKKLGPNIITTIRGLGYIVQPLA